IVICLSDRLQSAFQDVAGQCLPGLQLRLAEIGIGPIALRVGVHRRRLDDFIAAEVPAGVRGVIGFVVGDLSVDGADWSAAILSSHWFIRSNDSPAMSMPLVEPLRQMI